MKAGLKRFASFLWTKIKKNAWYVMLLAISSAYVVYYCKEIYDFETINARNLVFLIWIALLLLPLFSEMEFLGVKVKREVAKATEEIKDDVHRIETQITQIQLSTSASSTINLGNLALPSEQKMEELLNMVRDLQASHQNTTHVSPHSVPITKDKPEYLFRIRLNIETALRELSEKIGCTYRGSMIRLATELNRREVINGVTFDLIGQIIRIANRGVHGEIVSDEYIDFVRESYPELMRQLEQASYRLVPLVCPRCHFTGYSTSENVCPHCGFIGDYD